MTNTRNLTRLVAMTSIAALAGFAFAQGNLADLASGVDNLALVALIAGAVAWYRATPLGQRIDGVVTVALFAMITGAVVATALQGVGLLLFTPFHAVLGPLWGAAAAGLVAGIEAVFGVSITKYVANLFKRDETGAITIDLPAVRETVKEASGDAPDGTAVRFLLDTAERLLGVTPGGAALVALYPLIVRYAQDPAILTDDVRARIQTEVLGALVKAGLLGQDLR